MQPPAVPRRASWFQSTSKGLPWHSMEVPGRPERKAAVVLGGHLPGLAFIRGLGAIGVPIALVWNGRLQMARGSSYVGSSIEAPHPERDERDYLQFLSRLAERTGGGLLVPTSDSTVGTVARNKNVLERHYDVACVDWDVARRILDKKHTYELAGELGIPIARTFDFDSLEEIEEQRDKLVFPCVVRPRVSHLYFARVRSKMAIVETYEALVRAWSAARELGFEVLVQEFVPGDDTLGINYNAYFLDGRPAAECTARKVRLSPPRVGFPRVVVSAQVPEVVEAGRAILQGLGYHGFANVEFKLDPRDGVPKLMEVNGRYNNSGLLSIRAGINFPALMYRHLIEGELPPQGLTQRNGIYWIALPSDPVQSLRELRNGRASVRDFVRPYARRHVFDVLDARDPKPFLLALADKLGPRVRRALRMSQAAAGAPPERGLT
jgi:D-aspartate ligase